MPVDLDQTGGLLDVDCGLYQSGEERMRAVRPGLELRVCLGRDVVRMRIGRQLGKLDQAAVG